MESQEYFEGAGHYDVETVRFFDVAHEGAQLRAIAGACEQLADLYGMQPRSVVIVATDQIAKATARFVVQQRSPLRLPVVIADVMPAYIGALDVVLFVGDVADDETLSRSLITAGHRGATVILAGPARGPILEDAPSDAVVLPALPTVAGASPVRGIAAVGAVLDCLDEDAAIVSQRFSDLADAVDEEIQQLSPERDETVNPARQLRGYAQGARIVHSGFRRTGMGVAELIASVWSARGLASSYVSPAELPQALEQTGAQNDIFYDPILDGPNELVPLKAVIWAEEEAPLSHARVENCAPSGLGDAATALRLAVRGLAATALQDQPASDGV
ncbi:hypothetical protein QP027_02340 [Corynebacterium breve]|uniref:Exopolyphosphatase n=1 Tax=Corynebacterium breve TaxID=3049799 RepID=A0ABY8VF39_9CORY|nr:hypothetical protein [Corynebacterium breve]WIM68261.1 hypothetical protein QP027_02340 [Corynebacterium breve]